MSLVLSPKISAQPGKKALEQALQDYKSVLSDDEKTRLELSLKSGVPNESSVMVLTSEIDATQATRTSRRVGPRFQPFLEHVQRFTNVVDTFAQIHPVALASWGTVKLTLLLTSNFGSYFEKLSELFRQVGLQTPHFQDYVLLYPSSDALQDSLCAYHAAIIKFCQQAVKVSRRKGVFQVPRSALLSFDHDFQHFKKQIDEASSEVHAQIQIAASKVAVEESRLSQLEREKSDDSRKLLAVFSSQAQSEWSQMMQWREEQDLRQLRKEKQKLRDKLSTIDHRVPWRQARRQCVNDTAVWYRTLPVYTKWFHDDKSGFLWLSGSMGSGKSIVAGNVIADVNDFISTSPSCCRIAYFFCQNERLQTLTTRNIFGSLAAQLLDDIITQADRSSFETMRAIASDVIDVDAIVAFVARTLKNPGQYFVVLDGIDLLNITEAREVLVYMDDLIRLTPERFKVKIIMTARPDMKTEICKVFLTAESISMAPADNELDVTVYVNTTLMHKLQSGELQLTDIKLLEQIRDYLVYGSQGMFLWTKLLLEEICLCRNDEDIIQCLPATPLELIGRYRRIIEKISTGRDITTVLALFKWVTGAVRPLKTGELCEALTLAPGQKKLQIDKIPHDLHNVLRLSMGLVYIDEDEDTVHLVHHSLKQAIRTLALETNNSVPRLVLSLNPEQIDQEIGLLCMTYLLFEDLSRQMVKAGVSSSSLNVDLSKITQHVFETNSNSGNRLASAMSILQKPRGSVVKSKRPSQDSFNVEQKLRDMAEEINAQRRTRVLHSQQFRFLDYTKSAWVEHTKACSTESQEGWRLFERLIDSSDAHIPHPWKMQESCPWLIELGWLTGVLIEFEISEKVVLWTYWAFVNNHLGLIEHLLLTICKHIFNISSAVWGGDSYRYWWTKVAMLLESSDSEQTQTLKMLIYGVMSRESSLKLFPLPVRIMFATVTDQDDIPQQSDEDLRVALSPLLYHPESGTTDLLKRQIAQIIPDIKLWNQLELNDIEDNFPPKWTVLFKKSEAIENRIYNQLTHMDIAVLFGRTLICAKIAADAKDWDFIENYYLLALIIKHEHVANAIWDATWGVNENAIEKATKHAATGAHVLRSSRYLKVIALCIQNRLTSHGEKLLAMLPKPLEHLEKQYFVLLEYAWTQCDIRMFRRFLELNQYVEIVFSSQIYGCQISRICKSTEPVPGSHREKMRNCFIEWERQHFLANPSVISEALLKYMLETVQSMEEYRGQGRYEHLRGTAAMRDLHHLQCAHNDYQELLHAHYPPEPDQGQSSMSYALDLFRSMLLQNRYLREVSNEIWEERCLTLKRELADMSINCPFSRGVFKTGRD